MFSEGVLFFPLHFTRIYADGDILNHSKNETTVNNLSESLISSDVKKKEKKSKMKRSWSGAYCISQATSYAVEMKSEWKLPDAWPSEEGQNMYWFLFGPENCMSCVRLREGGGEPPQVKQLFEDEIIVWLHLFTPMAQRGSAKQHNWLCYLIAASASLCKDIFSGREFGWGTFCPAALSSGLFVKQPSKWWAAYFQ